MKMMDGKEREGKRKGRRGRRKKERRKDVPSRRLLISEGS